MVGDSRVPFRRPSRRQTSSILPLFCFARAASLLSLLQPFDLSDAQAAVLCANLRLGCLCCSRERASPPSPVIVRYYFLCSVTRRFSVVLRLAVSAPPLLCYDLPAKNTVIARSLQLGSNTPRSALQQPLCSLSRRRQPRSLVCQRRRLLAVSCHGDE